MVRKRIVSVALVATIGVLLSYAASAADLSKGAELDREYESLLRQILPLAVSLDATASTNGTSLTERELVKALARFRTWDVEKKRRECEEARTLLKKMSVPGAIEKERARAEASSLSMRGRNVFVGLIMANTEREAVGLPSVWPRASQAQTDSSNDISGHAFSNATDYFRTLLDMPNLDKENWSPYAAGLEPKFVFDEKTGKSRWIVASGVDDTLPDVVPVLLSDNVDPSSLVTAAGAYDASKLEGELRFTGDFAVIVRKGGAAQVVKRKGTRHAMVYGRQSFVIPKGFGYLAP